MIEGDREEDSQGSASGSGSEQYPSKKVHGFQFLSIRKVRRTLLSGTKNIQCSITKTLLAAKTAASASTASSVCFFLDFIFPVFH